MFRNRAERKMNDNDIIEDAICVSTIAGVYRPPRLGKSSSLLSAEPPPVETVG